MNGKNELLLNKQVFFSPGNHDLKGERKNMYLNNVGYFDTLIKESSTNSIILLEFPQIIRRGNSDWY